MAAAGRRASRSRVTVIPVWYHTSRSRQAARPERRVPRRDEDEPDHERAARAGRERARDPAPAHAGAEQRERQGLPEPVSTPRVRTSAAPAGAATASDLRNARLQWGG